MRQLTAIALVVCALTVPTDAEARRRTGTLVVKSATTGAEVFVNGRKVGQIPLKRKIRLRTGTHTVRVSKLGFADYLDSVKIRRGRRKTIEADLIELNGIIQLDSTPSNAEVIINGRIFGRTPMREVLEPGPYRVQIRAGGYTEFQTRLEVDAGQEITLNPVLVYQAVVPPKPEEPWYRNKWIWVGVATAVIATTVVTAVALTSDDPREESYPLIPIETTK